MHWDKVPGDNDDEVAARGILYLLIFQQLGQLVRWSWGYNVLLAPPENFKGTDENTNAQLENGQARREDECDHHLCNSSDIDNIEDNAGRDEQNTSGSDDTIVNVSGAGKGNTRGCSVECEFQSGPHTQRTHRQRTSSISSKLSSVPCGKSGKPPSLLPTPANGNINPSGQNFYNSLRSLMPSTTNMTDEETSKGLEGYVARCKMLVKKTFNKMSLWVLNTLRSTFSALPNPLQRALTKTQTVLCRFLCGVWSFMNPPLWAMLVAIIVASIPDLQRFFFADGSFFKNSVTSAIRQSGGVAVPLILVVLGGNLARNTIPQDPNRNQQNDKEETKLLIAAIISRMLLPVVVMSPILAVTAKFVPVSILDDPIFVIVCFLITGAPSALQLAQICQINNVYMGAMSRLLFQSYVVWILPSTLILVMCALEVVEWAQQ